MQHFLVGADDEIVVDADLAEFIDDDGVSLAMRLGQNAIEQRGLAGAQIAGEHGDGDFFGHFGSGGLDQASALVSSFILCRIMAM